MAWLRWVSLWGFCVAQAHAEEPEISDAPVVASAPMEEPEHSATLALRRIAGPERELAISLPRAVRDALTDGEWEAAESALEVAMRDAPVSARGDLAVVRAWTLLQDERPAQALPFLDTLASARTAPPGFGNWLRGEVLLAADRSAAALAAFQAVPSDTAVSGRALVGQATALRALGRKDAAREIEEQIASSGSGPAVPAALLSLAQAKPSSDDAYRWARELWRRFPASDEAEGADDILARFPSREPTDDEWLERAQAWMNASHYGEAILVTSRLAPTHPPGDVFGCRLAYIRGRSEYKRNRLSAAASAFGDAGRRCAGSPAAVGHKILYLDGASAFRRGEFDLSARLYQLIAELYPKTTYADDGLTRAGIAWMEAGESSKALAAWRSVLGRFPDGDTAPEATWRLAFALYDHGRPTEAIQVAEKLGKMPLTADEFFVLGGRYWSARWQLFPDAKHPRTRVEERGATRTAIDGWRALCAESPHHYYGLLAHNQLRRLAPDVAASCAGKRPTPTAASAWNVRDQVADDPSFKRAIRLLRIGLVRPADEELARVDTALNDEEHAWVQELRGAAGAWVSAHGAMHSWLRHHPLGTLDGREPALIGLAFPDHYGSLIRKAAAPYDFDARMFHALVRQESNFDREIVSFAGARGLSQLMPATARMTAKWMGRTVTMPQLFEPETNLTIGARYLQSVFETHEGNPFLAIASYNAGPNRITRWVDAWDNPPVDEFVERIPIRETRRYVKRVVGAWQTYRWWHDADTEPFADLTRFFDRSRPGR